MLGRSPAPTFSGGVGEDAKAGARAQFAEIGRPSTSVRTPAALR